MEIFASVSRIYCRIHTYMSAVSLWIRTCWTRQPFVVMLFIHRWDPKNDIQYKCQNCDPWEDKVKWMRQYLTARRFRQLWHPRKSIYQHLSLFKCFNRLMLIQIYSMEGTLCVQTILLYLIWICVSPSDLINVVHCDRVKMEAIMQTIFTKIIR